MEKEINFAIGFITGRPNVCKIINHYYKYILEQVKELDEKVNFTVYILYDLNYLNSKEEDFYKINPEVHKYMTIKYLTPEYVMQEKKIVMEKHNLTQEEASLLIGTGYAKARNSILYQALSDGIDYLLFWDDDEYPLACIQNKDEKLTWLDQDNILMHLKYIENADITFGHRCGYTSIFPYIDQEKTDERSIKAYVEAVKNEFTNWEKVKSQLSRNNGTSFAEQEIAKGKGVYEITAKKGDYKWILGSPLCINLNHLNAIPAFYNPEGTRGEDTFFSLCLNNTKVVSVPVYHFHDPFLKYTNILKGGEYPTAFEKAEPQDEKTEQRFYQASRGWIKYRPLYLYLTSPKHYEKEMKTTINNLKLGVSEMNKLFPNKDFSILLSDLEQYSSNVEQDAKNFVNTQKIWDKVKNSLQVAEKANWIK